MSDMWITIVISVVKFFAFTYDIITFLPYYLIEQPNKKLEVSRRLKVSICFTCFMWYVCPLKHISQKVVLHWVISFSFTKFCLM